MNKGDLNFNLNTIPTAKGLIAGAGIATVLSMLPFIIAHPNLPNLIFLLFAAGLSYEMHNDIKDQSIKNNKIITNNEIKDYKNPATWAFMCGLFGFQTLYFIPDLISNHQTAQMLATLLSAGTFATSIIGLAKNIQHNKQQINSTIR